MLLSFIPGDPKPQSKNGRLLMNIVNENGLIVVNGSDLCSGVITRYRKTSTRTEQSVLDFFIVCEKFFTYITSMAVDEARRFALTKFSTKTGRKSVKPSDHNTLILELDIRWNSNEKEEKRQEVYNFKNEEQFQRFEMLTESDKDLKDCFKDCTDVNAAANRWLKILNNLIKKSFKKIRIKQQKMNPDLEKLFAEKESIRSKINNLENSEETELDIDEVFGLEEDYEETVERISSLCADRNKKLVDEYLGKTKDTIEGFNQPRIWSLKKKLAPKNSIDPPSAMRDQEGNLVTDKSK